jgi:two-component system, chemotaxis family, chemotaxis protein CheY
MRHFSLAKPLTSDDDRDTAQMTKIIIIDDDALIRRMVSRVLTGSGYQVLEAENGRAGLAVIHEQKPDLIITDLMMPEQEGIETVRKLQTDSCKVPILVISGSDLDNRAMFLDMAKRFGADATLKKPFRPSELLEAVAQLLPS